MPSTNVRRGLYWSEFTETWHYEFRLKIRGVDRDKWNGDTCHVLEKDARTWLTQFKANLKKMEVGLSAQAPALSLREGLAAWLKAHLGCAPKYLVNVQRAIELHAGHLMDTPMDAIASADLEQIRVRYLTSTGVGHNGARLRHTKAGANKQVDYLRKVLAWNGLRGNAPRVVPEVKALNAEPKIRGVLWPEQVIPFLRLADAGGREHASPKPRDAPHSAIAIRLQVGLGMRENESLNTRWEWIDWRRAACKILGKGSKLREVPIPGWLLEDLRHLHARQGAPTAGLVLVEHTDKKGHQHPHRGRFTAKPVARCGRLLKILGLTPHRLRATFATGHWEIGTPLTQIQQMMGHEDSATTMKYIVARPKDQAQAQEKLAEAYGFKTSPPTVPEKKAKFKITRIKSTA